MGQDDVGCLRDQFCRMLSNILAVVSGPARVDAYITADHPARLPEPLQERPGPGLKFAIVCARGQKHADATDALALLPARRQRPRRRAAQQSDELASPHSITSSAR